ncbi:MAG: lactate utilization protein [Thalassobaculum sp.]|uniref:LutC/YkgG family protein n=1 Tax=Thalassobaculum sp. TaxID=2022740 RepID=UPI0032EC2D5B
MSAARDQILGSIRKSLGRGPVEGEAAAGLHQRLATPARNLIPDRTAGQDTAGLVGQLVGKLGEAACSVDEVASLAEVPARIAAWLQRENLPARLVQAPALGADSDERLDWTATPTIEVKTGTADGSEDTSVTPVFAAVAETGTLMLLSDATTPTGLNFLPENHIAVVRRSQVVGPLEDAWSRLRGARTAAGGAVGAGMPRSVNLITGPSRTGDIEQRIQMGAHGPRRLHVIVVDD